MKKWLRPLFPLLSLIGYVILKMYLATLRTTLTISKETKKAIEDRSKGAILMVWHDSLIALPLLSYIGAKRRVTILISNSRDGEIPNRIAHFFKGADTIRVQGGARHMAVQESLEALNNKKMILITPDGPRGPKRVMKPGTCFLAQKANVPLFAYSWDSSHTWHLSTWDKIRIPRPFSRVHAHLTGPFEANEETAHQAMANG